MLAYLQQIKCDAHHTQDNKMFKVTLHPYDFIKQSG